MKRSTSTTIIKAKVFSLGYLSMISIVSLFGCNAISEKQTSIKGLVYDQTNEAPIENLEILLRREWADIRPFGPVYGETVARTSTDVNGSFQFQLSLESRSKYTYYVEAIGLEEKHYFGQSWQEGDYLKVESEQFITVGKANHIQMPMIGFGQAELGATNASQYDSLEFTLTTYNSGHERVSYYRVLDSGEEKSSGVTGLFPQGEMMLRWDIKGVNLDTTYYEHIEIIKGEFKKIHFTFDG